jgi:hypothetical protein
MSFLYLVCAPAPNAANKDSHAAGKVGLVVIPSEARDLLIRNRQEKSRSLGQTQPSG